MGKSLFDVLDKSIFFFRFI